MVPQAHSSPCSVRAARRPIVQGASLGRSGGGGGGGFDAEVDAMNDGGYFARFGEAGHQQRGVHFGAHLGTQRL